MLRRRGRSFPLSSPFFLVFQVIDVLAMVMPSCKSGATSPSSLNTVKTSISFRGDMGSQNMEQRRTQPTAPKHFRREWSMRVDDG